MLSHSFQGGDRPRRRLRPAAVALPAAAALAAPVAPARAGEDGTDERELQARLEELVAAPGGPPGVIAVVRRGDRTEVHRAGVAE
ncbi:hypothetical protein [Streptomyces sp.]|uniref:hypothetical protein n=1 Tax=Streptomyces sp. TaxID=1931 RepID=UPI002F41EBB7